MSAILPPVLLVGCDNATALQVARVLANRGLEIVGTAANPSHWACRSNAYSSVLALDDTDDALVADLLGAPATLDGAVVIPCTDPGVAALAKAQNEVRSRFRFLCPSWACVSALSDKERFAETAVAAGAQVPRTYFVRNIGDLAAPSSCLEFPVVLKPAIKDKRWLGHAPAKAFKVDSSEALLDLTRRCLAWTDMLIVQEWIEGSDERLITVNCYVNTQLELEASVVSGKLRQWPPRTGTASSAEVTEDEEAAELAARIIASNGFYGHGYVEFKRTDRGGLVAIESNVVRPTGRSTMAESVGVDLHYAIYADAAGVERPRLSQQSTDGRWLDLRRELMAGTQAIVSGDLSPRKWWTSLAGPRRYAVASKNDPLPLLYEMRWTAGKLGRRLTKGRS
jgi:predicted ATP-grasp superfamily ATP-dependent carboligase